MIDKRQKYKPGCDNEPLTDEQKDLLAEFIDKYKTPMKLVKTKLLYLYAPCLKLGIDEDDVEQVAFLGVLAACRRFNPDYGTTFTTYAIPWIRRYVLNLMAHQRKHRFIGDYNKDYAVGSRDPMPAEGKDTRMILSMSSMGLTASNQNTGKRDSSTFRNDITVLVARVKPETLDSDEKAKLKAAMAKLDPRTRQCIMMRHGMNKSHNMKLWEIGEHFGITKERVRQIVVRGLNKLRVILETEKKI